jgi:hypothetical protein
MTIVNCFSLVDIYNPFVSLVHKKRENKLLSSTMTVGGFVDWKGTLIKKEVHLGCLASLETSKCMCFRRSSALYERDDEVLP